MESLPKLRVTTLLGTRPEIIRLSEIVKKFELNFNHRLFFSSQNRETYVGIDFFAELGIRQPDYIMKNTTSTPGEFLAELFVEFERELLMNRPDLVVILGDTNTSLGSIIARKAGIPIYHLESGNRSFDPNIPEEVNRKIVDHISDFNLAYTRHAESNLLREKLDSRNCIVIGTPLREVIEANLQNISNSGILIDMKVQHKEYFLVSAHRQENIDSWSRLSELLRSLNAIAERFKIPVIVTTHPRLKIMMAKEHFEPHALVRFVQPLGFIDYCKLQLGARIVLSDSGSISEESAILGFRAITVRDSMERPEALEVGSVLMSGLSAARIIAAIEYTESNSFQASVPADYLISNSSERVLNFILSTYHVRDFWSGRR